MREIPTNKKIIKSDTLSLLMFLLRCVAIPVVIIPLIIVLIKGGNIDLTAVKIMISAAFIVTLIAHLILRYKLHYIKSLFKEGKEAIGVITNMSTASIGTYLHYNFTLNNVIFKKFNLVSNSEMVKLLKIDDQIVILYDCNNPKRALVRSIYSEADYEEAYEKHYCGEYNVQQGNSSLNEKN